MGRESAGGQQTLGAGLLSSPKKLLRPLHTDLPDPRVPAAPSPGLLSIRSLWSASDLTLSSTHLGHDIMDTQSKWVLSFLVECVGIHLT
jgi:hypothetical protein